jgi:hypothetical protein
MRKAWLIIALAGVAVTGCDRSRERLKTALAEAKAAEAERDTLLSEVLETSQFVADVTAELVKVKGLPARPAGTDRGVPGAKQDREARKAALQQIKVVIGRLNETEGKLAQTESRLAASKRDNARLLTLVRNHKKVIEELQLAAEQQRAQYEAVVEDQRIQITTLASRVDTLSAQNSQLEATSAALADTVSDLTRYRNTVYYAAGTKDELMKQGVVTKEGSKFLFFGGTRLEPARDLKPEMFTAMDMTNDRTIPLPRSDKKYRIVSRQSPTYLASGVTGDGKVRGQVEIASPEEFWAASRYLILVQD